jgi:Major Facilitator Superfamily
VNAEPTLNEPSTKASGLAAAGLFFVNGLVFSNWVPRIPDVRDRLEMNNAGLGATLIGGGLGGIIGSLLVARFLRRFGSRRLVLMAATTLALILPLVAVAPSPFVLVAILTTLGFFDVLNDMAMNTQGTIVQGRLSRSIMQRLHAGWSAGAACGAGTGALASALDIGVGVHLAIVTVVLLTAIVIVRPYLIHADPPPVTAATASGSTSRRFSPIVAAMVLMAVGVAFAESAPAEWSAVTMRDLFSFKAAGVATVVFASSMLIARLFGDHLVERLGPQRMLDAALAVAVVGFLVIVVAPVSAVALLGFSICGFGVAVMFPQLYAMAATLPGAASGSGLGAMGIGQRVGFMAAPIVMGSVAKAQSLRWSFAVVIAIVLVTILSARSVLRGSIGHALTN